MEETVKEDGREDLKAILDALFLAAEIPLGIPKLCEILSEFRREEVVRAVRDLVQEYRERKGGFSLHEVAGGFQFRTNPEYAAWIRKLKGGRPASLTPAAMETLAIIAYRQPVVRAEIDRIRGVDSSGPLRGLLDKKFARMLGRKDVPGKPILYGTTKKFLETFDLKDLSELPTLSELKELGEDSEGGSQFAVRSSLFKDGDGEQEVSPEESSHFENREEVHSPQSTVHSPEERHQASGNGLPDPEDSSRFSVPGSQFNNQEISPEGSSGSVAQDSELSNLKKKDEDDNID